MSLPKFILTTAALFWAAVCVSGQNKVLVQSPDKNLRISVVKTSEGPQYSITYKGKLAVMPSLLGFEMKDCVFGPGVSFGKVKKCVQRDSYDLPVGKCSHVDAVCNEAVIPLTSAGRKIDMVVRAYDDGVAFRYLFHPSDQTDSLLICNERMDVTFFGDPSATVLPLWGFQNSHEGLYTKSSVSALPQDKIFDMPATFCLENGVNVAITEANMMDYPGMLLIRKNGRLTSRLSPRLDRPELSVISCGEHRSPWRVFMVSDRLGAFIESNILTNLADPCKIEDLSWLKPGKTTFPWWCDTACPDTSFQWGNNFGTNKYYVDFCARNGLEYHSVYGYADTPWYYNDGPSFSQAGPDADVTRPAPTLDFERLCRYAQSKGVDIHVWLNWKALYKDIDRVFTKFEEWGVKGMMVDFLDRDDQEMICIQEEILRKAAEHHLFIQFHGASKPSGLIRTYPNEFIREGALNYEFFKGDRTLRMGADHDISIPFTRLLAGPTDFHLGGFNAVPRSKFRFKNHEPYVTVTRSHMIAMYVVLEGYLSMVCDAPFHYEGQPGFDFLMGIPSNWDETRVPACSINEYVAVARRKGDQWWMGVTTNATARDVQIPLSFLPEGEWNAELLTDDINTETNPNLLDCTKMQVNNSTILPLHLASEGGAVIKLFKK